MNMIITDTREDGYCWVVRDEQGAVVAYLTTDLSAAIYSQSKPRSEEVIILYWENEPASV